MPSEYAARQGERAAVVQMFEPESHEIDLPHQLVRQTEDKIGIRQRGKWGEFGHTRRADNGIHMSDLVIHLAYRKRIS